MTKEELWLYAVDYAVPAGSQREKFVKDFLEQAKGDITLAMDLIIKADGTHWLANGGYCGPHLPRVELWGSLRTSKIRIWDDSEDQWNRQPDLEISWREVFQFIKDDRKKAFQLSLF